MIDVIITSTCRKTIEKTIKSFLDNVSYSKRFNFIVHIDVLNPHYLKREKEYLRLIDKTTVNRVELMINTCVSTNLKENFVRTMNCLHKKIGTKFYFNLQDDWIFLKKIDLDRLIALMEVHTHIDHIRFSKEKIKKWSWLYHLSDEVSAEYLSPNTETTIGGVDLVRVPTWSFNPHLGRTSVIKHFTDIPIGVRAETYICQMYTKTVNRNSIYIMGNIGDSATVRDIGRSRLIETLRKYRYIVSGGEYAEYIYS